MGRGALPLREARVTVGVTRRGVLQAGAAGLVAAGTLMPNAISAQQPDNSAGRDARPGADAPVTRVFSGRALDVESGRWLYTEQHRHVYQGGRWKSGQIRYVAPQGAVLGEKTLDFSQDPFVPLMRTVYAPIGQEEAITRVDGSTVTMETVRDGQRKAKEVARAQSLAVDSGFHAFVQAKLDELLSGKTIAMQLGVISQFDHFRFRIRRAEGGAEHAPGSVALRVEADSMLRLVVPTVSLVYDTRSKDMLEYEGMSNIVDPQTRKAPRVRIRYDYSAAGQAAQ
jgi:hypothetical protein